MIQITHFPYKEFFGKNDCYFCLPFVSYNATYQFKEIIRVDHNTKGCKNLSKFGFKLLITPKGDFYGKSDDHNLCLYSGSHHSTTF